ncbi:MAG TPA: hypothetical protein ENJ75_01870 [Candidatus Kaiserbacteria bacterium]|nr:hypothetical protein [Candidatus Kaiserbacteria bacterium]
MSDNVEKSVSPVQALLSSLNLSAYSQEEQEKILADLSGTIFQGVLVRLVEKMDDKTKKEFSEFVDGDVDGDEIVAFLRENVEGADDVVLEVVRDMTQDVAKLNLSAEAPK